MSSYVLQLTLLSRFCLGHLMRGGRKDNERSVVLKRFVLSPLSVALINYSINCVDAKHIHCIPPDVRIIMLCNRGTKLNTAVHQTLFHVAVIHVNGHGERLLDIAEVAS